MAVNTVQVTGNVLTPSGGAPVSGVVICKLSEPGSVLDGTDWQRVAAVSRFSLDADGALPTAFVLVPNDAILPAGTYYRVEFRTVDSIGIHASWTERWDLAGSPNPIDIGEIGDMDLTERVTRYTTATRPTASSEWRGKLISVKDDGSPEELHFCRETAEGGYEWITVAF